MYILSRELCGVKWVRTHHGAWVNEMADERALKGVALFHREADADNVKAKAEMFLKSRGFDVTIKVEEVPDDESESITSRLFGRPNAKAQAGSTQSKATG